MRNKLEDIIDKDKDSLRYYYLGSNWKRKIEHVGAKGVFNPEGTIII
ncbi:hypothetical protein N752_09390 [Desulforamulus aquiferis]|nr:hypothetical protein N752_09390 [Desulforamulus aquiferis]